MKPGEYRAGPYNATGLWCDNNEEDVAHLMNHMMTYTALDDASISQEFGSNVAIGYIAKEDVFLIKPKIIDRYGKLMHCWTTADFTPEFQYSSTLVYSNVLVRYTNKTRQIEERWFHEKNACFIHSITKYIF